jgi:hypothetical protein
VFRGVGFGGLRSMTCPLHPRRMLGLCVGLALVLGTVAQTVPATTTTYDTRACQPPYDTFPFCNTSLSIDERVADLVGRLQVRQRVLAASRCPPPPFTRFLHWPCV